MAATYIIKYILKTQTLATKKAVEFRKGIMIFTRSSINLLLSCRFTVAFQRALMYDNRGTMGVYLDVM